MANAPSRAIVGPAMSGDQSHRAFAQPDTMSSIPHALASWCACLGRLQRLNSVREATPPPVLRPNWLAPTPPRPESMPGLRTTRRGPQAT